MSAPSGTGQLQKPRGEKISRAVIVAGPTASGKSGLALELALRLNGIIINADSMQVYDALPVLTAQPDAAARKQTPHKLYGVLPPDDMCSAARWRQMALMEIRAAQQAGFLPIIVGGTGFYIAALVEGLSPIPEVPANIRDGLMRLKDDIGTAGLYALLQERDPETANRIDRHNPQRIVRALEVLAHTGKPLSAWQDAPREGIPADISFSTLCLIPPRETLYARCDKRLEEMIKGNVWDEVAAFMEHAPETSPLTKAVGYAELSAGIRGDVTRAAALEAAAQATRNYAKRQTTWFRNQTAADLMIEDANDIARAIEWLQTEGR